MDGTSFNNLVSESFLVESNHSECISSCLYINKLHSSRSTVLSKTPSQVACGGVDWLTGNEADTYMIPFNTRSVVDKRQDKWNFYSI